MKPIILIETSRLNNILNVYFFSKRSSYKTAVKSPGDSCVSSAGLFIENMLFDAAVIQSNAVKHCNIHFGEQLLQVKTKETLKQAKQQWDTYLNFKDWSRKSLHRQKVIVSGLTIDMENKNWQKLQLEILLHQLVLLLLYCQIKYNKFLYFIIYI